MKTIPLEYLQSYLCHNIEIEVERLIYPQRKDIITLGVNNIDLCKKTKIYKLKPLLRPLSQLYQEIEHKGKKFVPIIELLKLGGYRNFDDNAYFNFTSLKFEIWNKCLIFKHSENKIVFEFLGGSFNLFKIEPKYEIFKAANQLEMFQKLYEWHFDIHGLIEKNLAIDINTI